MDYAVETRGLARSYGEVRALDGIDLNISKGEIYGFLGPNGAGKTTLVRILITLLLPTSGSATVAGYDVLTQPNDIRLRIGAALQEAALDPKQTGREILWLQGRLYGLSRSEIDTRLDELSNLIDIGNAIDRLTGTYSGGMKRRLDLAASLIHNPQILFLDEPTTGLDPISRARAWEEISRINKQLEVTIFLTTQYLEEADELADRVGIINHGRLLAEGTPTELKRKLGNDVIIARVDGGAERAREAVENLEGVAGVDATGSEVVSSKYTNGAAAISSVALALNQRQVDVSEITLRTPTLDDVFLSVVGARMDEEAEDPSTASGNS